MKKITLSDFEVKSFVTTLNEQRSLTVKGGATCDHFCEDVGQPSDPTCCNCGGGGTGGGAGHTEVPVCPVSYPQIWCEGDTALCTN